MKRLLALTCLLIGNSLSPQSTALAEPVPEYAMKAAFLYNFAVFTEWPERMDGKLNICVLGQEAYSPVLESLNGKQVKEGLQLNVVRISSVPNARQCQILYFDAMDRLRTGKVQDELSNAPVLTVCDATENTTTPDAVIHLRLENSHLTFEVNQAAAHRAHLSFSSKMLRLARKVYQ